MRLKYLFGAGLMLASGVAVTSCSSDNNPDGPDKIMEAGSKFYVRVALANADSEGTRGSEDNTDENNYVSGDKGENEVKKILFVFYNADGGYVAFSEKEITETDHNNSGNIESIVDIVVPVTVQTDSKVPAYVVAYVNPTTEANGNKTGNLQDIQAKYRTLAQVLPSANGGNNPNGFLMTNSVYYEQNSNAPVVAAHVPADVLYEDPDEANKEGAKGITIYVERTMAKVSVHQNLTNGKQGTITDNMPEVVSPDGQTAYKLDFQELAWGLNNEERNVFVLKNFRKGELNNPTSDVVNMDWAGASSAMSSLTAPSWNYPAQTDVYKGRRSFWAYSANYFNVSIYPEFSDEITDDNASSFPLVQTKFSEIYDFANDVPGPKGHKFGEAAYTLENTMTDNVLRDAKAGVRAVTSALIVGKYRVLDNNNEEVAYDNLYIRRGETSNVIYINKVFMMQKFLETQTESDGVLYTYNGPNAKPEYSPVSWSDANKATIEADFEIIHPKKDVTGVLTASRYVTMILKETATLTKTEGEGEDVKTVPVYYFRNSNGLMAAVTADNRTQVNGYLYDFFNAKLGAVEEFDEGRAYFKVPIRHLWGRDKIGFGDTDATGSTEVDKGFVLGQYGVVRNHTYNINVQAIGGIGTGISDPDAPIVFPVDSKQYHVKTQIRVQKWRIVPQQNVTLKP
ncbi:MAG: fimbria major subunit [Muribaculaceae bacterium]